MTPRRACAACGKPDCGHPDLIYAGLVPSPGDDRAPLHGGGND